VHQVVVPRVYAARRPHIGYREDTATLTALDQLAAARGVDRSDILRAATSAYLTAQQRPEHARPSSVDLVAEPHVDAP